jgi:hypothetical protein
LSNFEEIHRERFYNFLYYLLHSSLFALLLDNHLALSLLPLFLGTGQISNILQHLRDTSLSLLRRKNLPNIDVQYLVHFYLYVMFDSCAVMLLEDCLAHEGMHDGDLLDDKTEGYILVGICNDFDEVGKAIGD